MDKIPENAYLLAGTNLGDRLNNLLSARENISGNIGEIISFSHIYESAPWGFRSDNPFYNQAFCVKTSLSVTAILQLIHQIEREAGRVRTSGKYTDRTIDIDILLFGDKIIKAKNLIIPHPFLHLRRFALAPMAEISPDVIHPVFKKSISQLLAECNDKIRVKKLE